jgi:hypothetical protein
VGSARGLDRLRVLAQRRLPRHAGRMFLGAFLFVLIAIEVTIQVVHSEGPAGRMSAKTWSIGVGPIVSQSTALGATVDRIRADATSLGRVALQSDLAGVVAGTRSSITELDTLGVSPPSAGAAFLLTTVLAERAQASNLLTGGIALAVGKGSQATAAADLAQAGAELILADDEYARFVLDVPVSDGRGSLGASQWITDPGLWDVTILTQWVAALRAAPALATNQALSLVVVSVEPPAVRYTGLPTTTTTTTTTTTSTTTTTTTTTTVPGQTTASTTPPTLPTIPTATTTTVPPTTTTLETLPPGAVSVLPPTASVSVVVVVADSGDGSQRDVVVTATLALRQVSSKGAVTTTPAGAVKGLVGTLAPGGARYLVLPPLKVQDGDTYILTVSVQGNVSPGAAGPPTDTFVLSIS